jgi:hypothetical protein
VFFIVNARDFFGSIIGAGFFFRDFFIYCGDGAIENVLLFFDTFLLLNGYDLVRDIGGFLWVGIEDADL